MTRSYRDWGPPLPTKTRPSRGLTAAAMAPSGLSGPVLSRAINSGSAGLVSGRPERSNLVNFQGISVSHFSSGSACQRWAQVAGARDDPLGIEEPGDGDRLAFVVERGEWLQR